jgi:16S rRNA (cytosine967-C5)-methyltransferase
MPEWIVEMWLREYGEAVTEKLLKGLLDIHPVSLRFDTRLSDEEREKIVGKIKDFGADIRQNPYLKYVYTVENVENISSLPGFSEGKFTVQDVSSALSVEAAGIGQDDFVMDICAAPGGKTLLASEKAGKVLSSDVSDEKIELISENLDRMNCENVMLRVHDATVTDDNYIEKADVVLMDVPCSGLGILGKKRDIKYNVSPESVKSLNELQKEIVKKSWQYVKPGGTLIYSTCTIDRTENEDMAAWIMDNFPFEPVPFEEYIPESLKCDIESAKAFVPVTLNIRPDDEKRGILDKCCVQMLPGYVDADGFFFVKMRRKVKR